MCNMEGGHAKRWKIPCKWGGEHAKNVANTRQMVPGITWQTHLIKKFSNLFFTHLSPAFVFVFFGICSKLRRKGLKPPFLQGGFDERAARAPHLTTCAEPVDYEALSVPVTGGWPTGYPGHSPNVLITRNNEKTRKCCNKGWPMSALALNTCRWWFRHTVAGDQHRRLGIRRLVANALSAHLYSPAEVTKKRRFKDSNQPFIVDHTLGFLSRHEFAGPSLHIQLSVVCSIRT